MIGIDPGLKRPLLVEQTGEVMKPWLSRVLKGMALIAVGAGLVYWLRFAPIPVDVHTVERGTIIAEVMGTGTLEARMEATVSPKISGRIAEVLVDQGERVKAGDILVRLDDEELQQQVAIAEANVEAANAAIDRLKIDKTRTNAVFEQADKSHERTQALAKQNAVSSDEIDKVSTALAVAVADVSRAEAAIAEGQKELISAQKTLQYHRARLHDTKIHAPFDGLIVKRNREPGDVVMPGTGMLTLISTDELWIRAWVDETEMARLMPDQPARVVFRSESSSCYEGTVARLGREADRETREFIVDVRVLELPTNWAVGQRAEAFVEIERRQNVVVLPAKLIVNSGDHRGVFVDAEGSAAWRELQLGVRSSDAVEIVDGLAEGDVVVTPKSAAAVLAEGRRVAIP